MFNYHLLSLTENIVFHHLNSPSYPVGKITVYIVYYYVNRMYVVCTRIFSSVRIFGVFRRWPGQNRPATLTNKNDINMTTL